MMDLRKKINKMSDFAFEASSVRTSIGFCDRAAEYQGYNDDYRKMSYGLIERLIEDNLVFTERHPLYRVGDVVKHEEFGTGTIVFIDKRYMHLDCKDGEGEVLLGHTDPSIREKTELVGHDVEFKVDPNYKSRHL